MATRKGKFNFQKIGMKIAGVGAGAVAGKVSNKFLGQLDPKIKGAAKIALGAVLPEFVKGEFMESMGSGIIAVGAAELVGELIPGIAGIGATEISEDGWIDDYEMNGLDDDELDDVMEGLDDDDVMGEIDDDDDF